MQDPIYDISHTHTHICYMFCLSSHLSSPKHLFTISWQSPPAAVAIVKVSSRCYKAPGVDGCDNITATFIYILCLFDSGF